MKLTEYATLELAKKQAIKPEDLRGLCDENGVPVEGKTRVAILAALDLLAARSLPKTSRVRVDRYAGSNTRCPICGFSCMVNGTHRQPHEDKIILTRNMKCLGPGNHAFPFKEIVVPAVAPVQTMVEPEPVKGELEKKPQKKQAKQAKNAAV